MNERVLRRFIILLAVATFVMFSAWMFTAYLNPPPGDFQTRAGDIHLGGGEFEAAIEDFDAALIAEPGHRGAMMGRAIALLQLGRHDEAEQAFTDLIAFLTQTLATDDLTGIATLAAAHANRGILYDRTARYEPAVADYEESLRIDRETVDGPGIVHKMLYNADPATIGGRLRYLREQLRLPEDQRLLHLPEKDALQRMYKP